MFEFRQKLGYQVCTTNQKQKTMIDEFLFLLFSQIVGCKRIGHWKKPVYKVSSHEFIIKTGLKPADNIYIVGLIHKPVV